MIMAKVSALVKYNPCSVYARRGFACPFFVPQEPRKCSKQPGTCDEDEYDGWLKDVIEGKTKAFYPRRITLLEMPGTVLLLYHSHKKAIVGEATIVRFTLEDNWYYYWFERFVLYPNAVSLRLLQTDPRAALLAHRGRWRTMYLSSETVEEIRELSELTGESKERLRRELEIAEEKSKTRQFVPRVSLIESKKLLALGLDHEVLEKAKEIFLESEKAKIQLGRSLKVVLYASLYLAYRSLNLPVKIGQISELGELPEKSLAQTVRLMKDRLGIKLPSVTPGEWILNSSKNLEVSQETIDIALHLIDDWKEIRTLKCKSPFSLAATAMYLGAVETRGNASQTEIAKAFGVSAVTVRNLVKLVRGKT